MKVVMIALFIPLLVACSQPKKPDTAVSTVTVVKTVVCSIKPVPIPEFQPVTFTTLIIEGTAWIGLSPVEHSSLQTNHARLVGYGKELQAELSQVQECIDRHNKDAQ